MPISKQLLARLELELAGLDGHTTLAAELPHLLERLSADYRLALVDLIPGGLTSLVIGGRAQGREIVLKLPLRPAATQREALALDCWAEASAAGLALGVIARDEESGALLSERVRPGTHVGMYPWPTGRREQIAHALAACHRGRPDVRLPAMDEWVEQHLLDWPKTFASRWRAPVDLQADWPRLCALGVQLVESARETVPLHGDLNVRNLLIGPRGVVVIDPRGQLGERAFDLATLAVKAAPHDPRGLALALARAGEADPERVLGWSAVWAHWYASLLALKNSSGAQHGLITDLVAYASSLLPA